MAGKFEYQKKHDVIVFKQETSLYVKVTTIIAVKTADHVLVRSYPVWKFLHRKDLNLRNMLSSQRHKLLRKTFSSSIHTYSFIYETNAAIRGKFATYESE